MKENENLHHQWEKGIIKIMNLDGWQLEWTGESMEHYDAKGKTPKGINCLIEFKLRNAYYTDKILEKFKYDKLMQQNNCIKFYYVFDCKGNYLYYLDTLKLTDIKVIKASQTTDFENKNKVDKEVYLLSESQASVVNKY